MNWVPCNIPCCLTCREHTKPERGQEHHTAAAELVAQAEAIRLRLFGAGVSGTNGGEA